MEDWLEILEFLTLLGVAAASSAFASRRPIEKLTQTAAMAMAERMGDMVELDKKAKQNQKIFMFFMSWVITGFFIGTAWACLKVDWISGFWALLIGLGVGLYVNFVLAIASRRESDMGVTHYRNAMRNKGILAADIEPAPNKKEFHEQVFYIVRTVLVYFGSPLGLSFLLLLQTDPRRGSILGGQQKIYLDNFASYAVPAGLLAFIVGYHVLVVLHWSIRDRENYRIDRKKYRFGGTLNAILYGLLSQIWLWLLMEVFLGSAVIFMYVLGETRVSFAMLIGIIASFLATLPELEFKQWDPNDVEGWVTNRLRRGAFHVVSRGILRIIAIPIAGWCILGTWHVVSSTTELVNTLSQYLLRGLILALPISLIYLADRMLGRWLVPIKWPIGMLMIAAAIAMAPIMVGMNTIGLIGLLAILGGVLLGYVCSSSPKGVPYTHPHRTSIFTYFFSFIVGMSLKPLFMAGNIGAVLPISLLSITSIGLLYGSWLRQRFADVEYEDIFRRL